MPEETKRRLKVFLCHASADKPKVRELYRTLRRRGIQPWLDSEDLIPGQNWEVEIPKALRSSDAIIICLSVHSVDKEGYVQKEIKFALDKALEMPEGRIFIIPARLEECDLPDSLSKYQAVNLFEKDGYARLMGALKLRASQLMLATVELPKAGEITVEIEKIVEEKKDDAPNESKIGDVDVGGNTAGEANREKAQVEADEKARQKAAKEKAKRDNALEVVSEREERQAARKTVLKKSLSILSLVLQSTSSKSKSLLKFMGIIGTIVLLTWIGSSVIPKLATLVPTTTPSLIPTPQPRATNTFLNLPISRTNTPLVIITSTKTPVPPFTPTTDLYETSLEFDLNNSGSISYSGTIRYAKDGYFSATDSGNEQGFICSKLAPIPSEAQIVSAVFPNFSKSFTFLDSGSNDRVIVDSVDIGDSLSVSDRFQSSYGELLFDDTLPNFWLNRWGSLDHSKNIQLALDNNLKFYCTRFRFVDSHANREDIGIQNLEYYGEGIMVKYTLP